MPQFKTNILSLHYQNQITIEVGATLRNSASELWSGLGFPLF